MSGYKHIETAVASFIAGRYLSVIEVGAGSNLHAASLLQRAGIQIRCIDIRKPEGLIFIPYFIDDVMNPTLSLYENTECIFAIRPVEEMVDPLIRIAKRVNADLFVYHLGFEGYGPQRPIKGCGVALHQYFIRN